MDQDCNFSFPNQLAENEDVPAEASEELQQEEEPVAEDEQNEELTEEQQDEVKLHIFGIIPEFVNSKTVPKEIRLLYEL